MMKRASQGHCRSVCSHWSRSSLCSAVQQQQSVSVVIRESTTLCKLFDRQCESYWPATECCATADAPVVIKQRSVAAVYVEMKSKCRLSTTSSNLREGAQQQCHGKYCSARGTD
jgi:hypothetical protein